MSPTIRLFVYGTLMRGERAHALLEDAEFQATAVTAPGYALLDLGAYPGMVREGAGVVHGELYLIDSAMLPRLDAYEGCPELFERVQVELADASEATGYLFRTSGAASSRIPNGNWRARRR